MSVDSARSFVAKMREDKKFRQKVLKTENPDELSSFLNTEGLNFDLRDLAGAMAECMEQLETAMLNQEKG